MARRYEKEKRKATDAALKAAIDADIAGVITHAGAYLNARLAAEKV